MSDRIEGTGGGQESHHGLVKTGGGNTKGVGFRFWGGEAHEVKCIR